MTHRFLMVLCQCGAIEKNVHYAPERGLTTHKCSKCGAVIDLAALADFASCDTERAEYGCEIGQTLGGNDGTKEIG